MSLVTIFQGRYGTIEVHLHDIYGTGIGCMVLSRTLHNGFVCYAPVGDNDNLYRDIHEECYYEC